MGRNADEKRADLWKTGQIEQKDGALTWGTPEMDGLVRRFAASEVRRYQ